MRTPFDARAARTLRNALPAGVALVAAALAACDHDRLPVHAVPSSGCGAGSAGGAAEPDFHTWMRAEAATRSVRVTYHVAAACDARLEFQARRVGAALRVRVVDTNGGGARASCACERREQFVIEDVPAGRYQLALDHGPYGNQTAEVVVP